LIRPHALTSCHSCPVRYPGTSAQLPSGSGFTCVHQRPYAAPSFVVGVPFVVNNWSFRAFFASR
jgi:hypothetical protein